MTCLRWIEQFACCPLKAVCVTEETTERENEKERDEERKRERERERERERILLTGAYNNIHSQIQRAKEPWHRIHRDKERKREDRRWIMCERDRDR